MDSLSGCRRQSPMLLEDVPICELLYDVPICDGSHPSESSQQFRSPPISHVHSSISYPLEVGCIAPSGSESASVMCRVLSNTKSDSVLDDASLIDAPVLPRTGLPPRCIRDANVILPPAVHAHTICGQPDSSLLDVSTPKRFGRKAGPSSVTPDCLKPHLAGRMPTRAPKSRRSSRLLPDQFPSDIATDSAHPPPNGCPVIHDGGSLNPSSSQCPLPCALAGTIVLRMQLGCCRTPPSPILLRNPSMMDPLLLLRVNSVSAIILLYHAYVFIVFSPSCLRSLFFPLISPFPFKCIPSLTVIW
ncbi:Zn-binding protein Push (ISS) [Corchorus capsularis]|uniref:Zn-binding protein Push (ISS) n=1 Tax=Corchorus capsularis TaxID=210143 RepID=A0A1R3HID1_COCAP|nr:Zn-binding protein Push (ISS) [Corchorus capsularis]